MGTIVPERVAARIRRFVDEVPLQQYVVHDDKLSPNLPQSIARARLVTFDVFDTALLRIVERPSDVFALANWRFAERNGREPCLARFVTARKEAESAARRAATSAGRGEVTLAEIYALLQCDALESGEREALREEELATERAVCTGNRAFVSLFCALRDRGRDVAFLSDTYLPKTFISELLRTNGYAEPLQVFTSSSFGETKADGKIFALAAREANVDVSDVAHIGDNPLADVRNARRAGVAALWYRLQRLTQRKRLAAELDESALATSLLCGLSAASPREGAAQNLARDVAAPLYLGFTQWLLATLETDPPDAVLFCARDGLIVKRVYDRLRTFYPKAPPSTYFLISRRTLVFPSFVELGKRELDFLCANPIPMSPRAFLERIGLVPDGYAGTLGAAGLALDRPVSTGDERDSLRRFFKSIEKDVLEAATRDRELLLRYLDELGCRNWSRIAVCDIGWHGSLQRGLADVLRMAGRDVGIEGYYVGLSDHVPPEIARAVHGWLWKPGDGAAAMRVQDDGREVVEMLFTARHPTVVGRVVTGERTYAIFDRAAELDANNRAAAGAIQSEALRLIDAYVAAFGGVRPAHVSVREVYERVRRLIEEPRPAEVAFIGNLVHVAGFGATRSGQRLANPPSPGQALLRPSEFLAAYRRSRWPTGFLTAFVGTWHFAAAWRTLRRTLSQALRSSK